MLRSVKAEVRGQGFEVRKANAQSARFRFTLAICGHLACGVGWPLVVRPGPCPLSPVPSFAAPLPPRLALARAPSSPTRSVLREALPHQPFDAGSATLRRVRPRNQRAGDLHGTGQEALHRHGMAYARFYGRHGVVSVAGTLRCHPGEFRAPSRAKTSDGVIFEYGNYVFQFTGGQPDNADLRRSTISCPNSRTRRFPR